MRVPRGTIGFAGELHIVSEMRGDKVRISVVQEFSFEETGFDVEDADPEVGSFGVEGFDDG